MTPTELQQWLNAHGQMVVVDGQCGPKTREAIVNAFTSDCASAVTDADIATLATRLGCSVKQLKAVAKVESGGSAFDRFGRPKILFERHLFHRFTGGRFGQTAWSNPKGGGYNEDSWDKLTRAACQDVGSAFAAVSWGKFQVLGMHWDHLGYPSALEMAYTTVTSEAAHYEMLARFVEFNGLKEALKKLSTDPERNIAFASRYNGPAFRKFAYHSKLAEAMS
jgi:hypothetical protein